MGPSRGYLLATFLLVISPCLLAGPLERVANTTMPLEVRPTGYKTVPAFPGVPFDTVVGFATPPGEANRLFVLEKVGRIVVITNLAAPNRTVFFDISSRVDSHGEGGLLGLAFHPGFQNNRLFFVFYTAQASSQDLNGQTRIGLHDRLSRFQVYPNNPNRGDEASEQNLISQYDRASNHNGGDIHFGPDGYLYVSLGDEGGGNDQFGNSQRIDRNFFSGMLRLDVDIRPGSKPPNPHAAVALRYAIPPDNPFIGLTSFNGAAVDPGRVRTEFWAVGLRNPWRFSFDPVTGDLLCGDVGQGSREEVNLIQRGGNYGWNHAEGSLAFGMFPPGFTDIKPIAEYKRPGVSMELERQGYCVIGGVVYRGSRMPELFGKYIFGDWGTGLYWSLQHNGIEATEFTPLFAGPSMNCFGIDPRNGDVLIGNQSVLRLIPDLMRPPGEPIALAVDGFGSIRRLTNGQLLESGRSLTVTAMPAAGQLFSHWTGTILSSTNPLRFQMQSGMTLTANFVTNRFLQLQGAYHGLIHAPAPGGAFAFGSGGFNGTVNSVGAYSLRLDLAGQRTTAAGRFGANGRATNQIANQVLGPLRLELAFTATYGVDLTGRIVGSNWIAGITGIRPHPRDPIGFTWTTDIAVSPPLPLGDAFGTIRVDGAGRATLQGRLATGESLTHSTAMSGDGRLPIFLKGGQRSSVIGWIQAAENGRALSGVLTWSNTESDTPLRVNAPIVGSIHTKDYSLPAGTPISVTFSGGGLTSVMSNLVVVDASRLRWTSSVPPMVSARMDWRSGLFSGQFSPEDYRPRNFRGAVLQEHGYGVGYFQGPSESGRVLVRFW